MTARSCHSCETPVGLPMLGRIGVGLLLAVGVVRAVIFLVFAGFEIPAGDSLFVLEGANVHFAWCAQQGLPLYPDGHGPAYTVNLMGPAYFALVGAIGRIFHADIATLFVIGRLVTLACTFGMAGLAAWFVRRRYGPGAALIAFVFTFGAAPMVVFGLMARPDMMANLAGALGFFVATRLQPRWTITAAFLFAISFLTKQTMIVWLVVAVAALLWERDWRRAMTLVVAAVVLVVTAVAGLALTVEPNIVAGLIGQADVAADWQQCKHVLYLLAYCSPELIFFTMIGGILWARGKYEDNGLMIFAIVWAIASVASCAKHGSDLNYFIPLCLVEAIVVATLCIAMRQSDYRQMFLTAVVWVGVFLTFSGSQYLLAMTVDAVERCTSSDKIAEHQTFLKYVKLAEDPNISLFADNDRLSVFQGSRAVFQDAYLFRLQVETGRIEPKDLIERFRKRQYQYVVLSADVTTEYPDPAFRRLFFYRMPEPIAKAIVENYKLHAKEAGFYVYVPR
jgi:hypothetical protein